MNISLDEALRRLEIQNSIGELGAVLESQERNTFAGLWIENEPDYRVVVRFTRDADATIRRHVGSGPLAEVIDDREADFTLVELRQAHQDAERILQRLGINSYSTVDVKSNRVEVFVPDPASLDSLLKTSGTVMPASVRVKTVVVLEAPATYGKS